VTGDGCSHPSPAAGTREIGMIELTKLQNAKIVVNADLIEFVESTPDTLITTTTGKKLMVRESVDEVVKAIIEYKRRCLATPRKRG
jgi:flagellar protein FlbD